MADMDETTAEAWRKLGLQPSPLWVPKYRTAWLRGATDCFEGKDIERNPYSSSSNSFPNYSAWLEGWRECKKRQHIYYQEIFQKVQNSG